MICCAGPWINDLEDVGVEPVRGLVLLEEAQIQMGNVNVDSDASSKRGTTNGKEYIDKLEKDMKLVVVLPVMKFGYGTEGIHFTLSSRDDRLLIGASREEVGFSSDGLDNVQCAGQYSQTCQQIHGPRQYW